MTAQTKVSTSTQILEKLKKPNKYKVIFHNDDKTPFQFVEMVLMEIFHKSKEDSELLAQKIHESGKAVVAIYVLEIASTKQALVIASARKLGFPLVCTLEEE